MKRVFGVNDVKAAAGNVRGSLNSLSSKLSEADQSALGEMLDIADRHATEISQDELAVVEAGVGAKPMSSHSYSAT